jgi:hypothetical protein
MPGLGGLGVPRTWWTWTFCLVIAQCSEVKREWLSETRVAASPRYSARGLERLPAHIIVYQFLYAIVIVEGYDEVRFLINRPVFWQTEAQHFILQSMSASPSLRPMLKLFLLSLPAIPALWLLSRQFRRKRIANHRANAAAVSDKLGSGKSRRLAAELNALA